MTSSIKSCAFRGSECDMDCKFYNTLKNSCIFVNLNANVESMLKTISVELTKANESLLEIDNDIYNK